MVKIEYRKLINLGKDSFVITLPKKYVKKNNLKKGDTIYIDDRGSDFIVSAKNKEDEKKVIRRIIVDANNKNLDFLKTEIVSSYLTNYDIIEITGKLLERESQNIRNILRDLAGFEIIEQTSSKIVAKDFLDIKEVSIRAMIRRMDMIIRGMMEDAWFCIENDCNKVSCYENIYQRDKDVNRLVFLTYRVLRNALRNQKVAEIINMSYVDILTNWSIVMRLEKIGDQSKRLARHFVLINPKKDKKIGELKKMYFELKQKYLDVMKSYYTNDKELALRIEVENKNRIQSYNEFLEKNGEKYIKIVEQLKNMSIAVRHIARNVIGGIVAE